MKNIIPLCVLLGTTFSWGETLRSPIHSVEQIGESSIIKFANGRVAFAKRFNPKLSSPKMVEAKIDANSNLIAIQSLGEAPVKDELQSLTEVDPPVYEPTIVSSLAEAHTIFSRLNPHYKRASECSNRAHVWASEEFKNNGIKSMKVFVLFTASYINRTRFKWWFHVAPMLMVNEGNEVRGRVLDYMFNRTPLTIKEWTDQFVFSKRACKVTTKFSEYDVNPQTEDCYLMTATMYHWMPGDLSAQETQGIYKTSFSQSEIRAAYSEAF